MKHHSKSPKDTALIAEKIIKDFPDIKLFLLYGDLGAGKTTFVKGLAQFLKLDSKDIKSPTFTFINRHENLLHYDLYRLEKLDQILHEQILEDLENDSLKIIEWPELIEDLVKIPHLKIKIAHLNENEREINVEPS